MGWQKGTMVQDDDEAQIYFYNLKIARLQKAVKENKIQPRWWLGWLAPGWRGAKLNTIVLYSNNIWVCRAGRLCKNRKDCRQYIISNVPAGEIRYLSRIKQSQTQNEYKCPLWKPGNPSQLISSITYNLVSKGFRLLIQNDCNIYLVCQTL